MLIRNRLTRPWVAPVLLAAFSGTVLAAEVDLAQVLPAPSLIYLGWSGAEAAGPALNETAFGRMLAEPEFERLCQAFSAQIQAVLKRRLAESGKSALYDPAKEALRMLWRRPGAINVMRFTLSKTGADLEAAAVWHLGREVEAFDGAIKTLTEAFVKAPTTGPSPLQALAIGQASLNQYSLGKSLPLITWGRVGEYYILTTGANTPRLIVDALTGKPDVPRLAGSGEFAVARKALAADGATMAFSWYVDVPGIVLRLPLIGTAIDMQAGGLKPPVGTSWGLLASRGSRALGLKDVKSLSGAVHFQGRGCRVSWYLSVPGAGTGLIKLFQQKPLTDADLAVVPGDATFFYSTNLDLNGFYQEMMTAFKQIDPNAHQAWLDTLAEGQRTAGVELVKDILEPLDDGWTLYNSPSSGGAFGTGLILLVETRDPAHTERAVTALAQSVVEHIGGEVARLVTYKSPVGQTIRFIDAQGGASLGVMLAPAWAVAGRHLIIGLYPQTVATAAERLVKGQLNADSIVKRPDFAAQRKLLPKGANAIGYLDAADILGTLYRLSLPVVKPLLGQLAGAGTDLDISIWPRAQTVERHLFGMVTGLAADEQGVLMVSHGPLPIATPSARSAFAAGAIAAAAIIGREKGDEPEFANLRAIATGCHRYAAYHDEKFPPALAALADEKLIPGQTKWLSAYGYVEGLSPYDPPWCVMAYDESALKAGAKRVAALLVTGRCVWREPAALSADLAKTRQRLSGRQPATEKAGESR
jgi:hypothetical protein